MPSAPSQPETSAPQIENDTLNIHDKQGGTRGGAPIPYALLAMAGIFVVAMLIALLVMMGGDAATAPAAVPGQ